VQCARVTGGGAGLVRSRARARLCGVPDVGEDLPAPYAEVQVEGNQVAILKDGGQAFPAMLRAIARAQSSVFLETYIYRDDTTGRRFADALMERARAGVTVLVLYDDWGSSMSDWLPAELRAAGVKVLAFRPVRFRGSLGRLLGRLRRRNHRKALVVDGAVAFTGGLNIGDDYAAVEDGGAGWRDTHLRIAGPAAGVLERLFLQTWRTNRGAAVGRLPSRGATPNDGRVRILGSDFRRDRKDIRRAYLAAIASAQDRIFLTHAYFLPPVRLLKLLTKAARRGVRVALIIAGSTDVQLVLYAARGLYPRLLRAGIEVYEWQGRVLHAKTAVVDGRWTTIGSSNLDALSLRANLEVNAVVEDTALAEAMERMFVEDLVFCERITRRTVGGYGLLQRIAMWVAFQFRSWL
jgi:cardiolipin synthase